LPKNWRGIGRLLSFRDKLVVSAFLLVIAASFIVWCGSFYYNLTRPIAKNGGEYVEGAVGQPLYVNPLLSQTSEADSDLTQLVYSGLFKYNNEGDAIPDLAENYSISDDQREYVVKLRKNVTWQDGKPFTAEDVFFTFNILQDPAYKSPLRQSWQGVEVKVMDDYAVSFSLKNPYMGFLENLTVGILPKHVWENIAPEKFALADYNLHPIGSGPFMFSDFQKDSQGSILTYHLKAFKDYYAGNPHISKFTFNFYPDEEALIAGYNKKEVMGMSSISPEKVGSIKNIKSTNVHELILPRYFAVFFNQTKSVALADDNVRAALNLSVDRKEIIEKVLHGKGIAISSPLLPQMKIEDQQAGINQNIQQANKILDDAGWKKEDNEFRKKGNAALEFELVTTDWPELSQTVELLATQWRKVGAKVNVKILTVSDFQQNYIRTREYDSLLFGQAITFNPDLYSFWHSSQKRDPGLNLSLFDNNEADGLLESVRQESDENKRIESYKKFQEILGKEVPAVFLYGPYYLYPVSTSVHGIEIKNINTPAYRFTDVNKWYIKTSRVLK
jgi:peptide/nickel transport system substrate-binding protein